MKRLLFISIFALFLPELAFSQTLAEKLGYSKEDKLVIIHADDIGLSLGKT